MPATAKTWGKIWDKGGHPLVIGHRGASAKTPENSLEAFRRAALDGADGVELDVLCCATGEVVVFHDDDLARLAGRPERIDQLPFDGIRNVRLGSGVGIPTLEEAFEACGPDLLVNVELKTTGLLDRKRARLIEGVSRAIDRANAASHVLVSSFSPMAIQAWQAHRRDVKAGLLFEEHAPLPLRRAWALSWLRPFAAHPGASLCSARAIEGWHQAGYAVNVWTVDDPAHIRELQRWGADGIITNDPAAARSSLGR